MSNTGKKHGNGNGHRNENKKTYEDTTNTKVNTTSTNIRSFQLKQGCVVWSVMSNLLQLMSKMVTRLKSIEKKVTKSVDELDQIKTLIKSVTQKVSTVEREVTTLKQQYT